MTVPSNDKMLRVRLLPKLSIPDFQWRHYRATLAGVTISGKVLTFFRTVLLCICALRFCQTDSDRETAVVYGHHVSETNVILPSLKSVTNETSW